MLALIPDHIVARQDSAVLDGPRAVFDLIRVEAHRHPETPLPLIARLTELLFFYALRSVAARDGIAPGLWSLMRRAEFAPLITAIIDTPAKRWTTDSMAEFVDMSRVRLAIGILWSVLVPAEMLGVSAELGYLILDTRDRLAYSELTAVILVIGALGFLLDDAARMVYRRFGAGHLASDE